MNCPLTLYLFPPFGKAVKLAMVVCGVLFLVVLLSRPCGAADSELVKRLNPSKDIPWRVTADESIVYDKQTDQIFAKDHVVFQKLDIRLTADSVRYDRATQTAFAEGNVRLEVGQDILTGSRLEMNLTDETGTLYNGTLFIKQNNFHIQGDKIRKTGANTYQAERVRVTTCEGDCPDWEIRGKDLSVTVEGYGVVKDAIFRVKKMPLLYVPILPFPVKQKRQSGLLIPELGVSERRGGEIHQPYFWAINDSSDATLYAHMMTDRGVKAGIEYRYLWSEAIKGAAMFDFLSDRKVDDGTGTTSADYGYESDRTLRPNSDRYWFRMKHDHGFDNGFTGRIDLDIVSDKDYLQEFKSGYTGFNDTEAYFIQLMGRELDDFNDPVRANRISLNRGWAGYSLNAELLWWDDVIARRFEEPEDIPQRLPSITFDRFKQSLFASPIYLDFETEYTYFYREDGTKGHRADIHPRVYLPGRLGGMLSVEPSVGFRQTIWQVDSFDGPALDRDRTTHRELYDLRLDLSTEIFNTFQADFESAQRIKHAMRLQAIYDYIPEENQEAHPLFDTTDRIEAENRITYAMTHTFTARRTVNKRNRYHQFGRLKLEQYFDFKKDRDDDPEPFSPIRGELQLDLGPACMLQADSQWSVYDAQFVSRNIAARFADRRGDRLFVEHRYTQDTSESVYLDGIIHLTPNLWLLADYERNIKNDEDIAKGVGLLYQSQCWSFELAYESEDDDASVSFMINLFGLGNMGRDPIKSRRANRLPDSGFY
ncbi:MAG: LPS-assembly protein LptD [Deltaproteobacteria bacterium]|nr:LPS-assembly protein LptD [Deltaproteobacteria bacterium]